jgi:hypothetical protein
MVGELIQLPGGSPDQGPGLLLHAVVKFMPQKHSGEKVFWETGRVGGARATVGLNDDDKLFFRVVTATLNTYTTTSPITLSLEDPKAWMVLWCGLQHFSQWRSRLFIAVNGAITSERQVENLIAIENWGLHGELAATLGANLEGQNHAAFELVELGVLAGVPTNAELSAVLDVTHSRYKLPDGSEPYRLVGSYA